MYIYVSVNNVVQICCKGALCCFAKTNKYEQRGGNVCGEWWRLVTLTCPPPPQKVSPNEADRQQNLRPTRNDCVCSVRHG